MTFAIPFWSRAKLRWSTCSRTDGSNSAWALAASKRSMSKPGWASIGGAPGLSGWPRRSPSSRVCSKARPVTFAGRHYHVTGHTIGPLPVQKPHPPILIGGNGPSLLALAAREADIVGLSGLTFRKRRRRYRRTCPDGGYRASTSGWSLCARSRARSDTDGWRSNALVQRVIVTDDRRGAAEELTRRWTQLTPDEILQSPYVLIGSVDQMVEDIQARRKRWGISYYVVHEPYLEDFAPVVARLAGR